MPATNSRNIWERNHSIKEIKIIFLETTWLHYIILKIIDNMTVHNGQLNALFDIKEIKYYFINFYCLSSCHFSFRCFALLEKAEQFPGPHAVIPLIVHL